MKMKSFLITLFMLIGICSSIQAQTFQWGVRAGASINTKSNTRVSYDNKWRPGFNAGLVGVYNISDAFALEADLQYSYVCSKDSARTINAIGIYNFDQSTKSHFIDLPVLAKVKLWKGLSIEAGPQLGLQVCCMEYKGSGTMFDFYSESEMPYTGKNGKSSHSNLVNLSLAGGLSYAFSDHLSIDARYVHALTNHKKDSNSRNRTIQLGVSYLF